MTRPAFKLTADGEPFASDRILSIEVTDEAGGESDELVIHLDDDDPQIERPREGAELRVWLGYDEIGLVDLGTFVVEELEREGWPRRLTIYAKAADHAGDLKSPRTDSYDGKTFGQIAQEIASRNGLRLRMVQELASIPVPYIAQTEESDQHLLTRLARRYGAIAAPKSGFLVVTPRSSSTTASGASIPPIKITGSDLLSDGGYLVRVKPRSRHSEVRARWQDRAAGTTKIVTVKTGREGPSMTLRDVFQNEREARDAADARVKVLKTGEGELELTLEGRPGAKAEAPLDVQGVDIDADGEAWIVRRATHVWDFQEGGGARTSIEADFGPDDEAEDA